MRAQAETVPPCADLDLPPLALWVQGEMPPPFLNSIRLCSWKQHASSKQQETARSSIGFMLEKPAGQSCRSVEKKLLWCAVISEYTRTHCDDIVALGLPVVCSLARTI